MTDMVFKHITTHLHPGECSPLGLGINTTQNYPEDSSKNNARAVPWESAPWQLFHRDNRLLLISLQWILYTSSSNLI